jgi:hypothetical protein
MHMKMSSMVFDLVVLPLWLPLWCVLSSFYMSPHCDSSSHNLCNVCQFSLYNFVFSLMLLVWYFMVLKVHSLLAVIMFSSHNIAISLCCCNVDRFILIVTIMKYDCKPALNTIVKKMYLVGTYKP